MSLSTRLYLMFCSCIILTITVQDTICWHPHHLHMIRGKLNHLFSMIKVVSGKARCLSLGLVADPFSVTFLYVMETMLPPGGAGGEFHDSIGKY